MAKKFYKNKELDAVCEDVDNKKLLYTFKRKRTGHDVNRQKRAKKEQADELAKHVAEHRGMVREGLKNLAAGWTITYIHPEKRYMTLQHPEFEHKRFTVNGADNTTEIESWISQYGFTFGIFLPSNSGNTVLPADFKERFGK